MAAGPRYTVSTRTAQKTPLPTIILFLRYGAVTYQWLFLWLHSFCFEQICHNRAGVWRMILRRFSENTFVVWGCVLDNLLRDVVHGNSVMKLWILWSTVNFIVSWGTISFSTKALLHGVGFVCVFRYEFLAYLPLTSCRARKGTHIEGETNEAVTIFR
jgi:hypothetical protein